MTGMILRMYLMKWKKQLIEFMSDQSVFNLCALLANLVARIFSTPM